MYMDYLCILLSVSIGGIVSLEHVACISCTVVLVISDRYRIWGIAVVLVLEQVDFRIISGIVS